jgi:tetratricopeptide (TPR) repeat protein
LVSAARTCLRQGQLDEGLALGTACLDLSTRLDDAHLWSESQEVVGSAHFLAGEYAAARKAFDEAIALDRANHDLPLLIRDLISAAKASESQGSPADAAAYWVELEAVAQLSQDLPTALRSALRAGEVLKTSGRHGDAARRFGRATYLARALGDAQSEEQSHFRLGKLYLELGNPEQSIAHRLFVARAARAREEYGTAASYLLLAANTFERTLGRRHDALPLYREALEAADRGPQHPDRALMAQGLESCSAAIEGRPVPASLRTVLLEATSSELEADRVGAALALTIDYDLWNFELRSFCAYCERTFGQVPGGAAPASPSISLWPLIAEQQLARLEECARAVHADDLMQAAARARRLLPSA